MRRFIRLKLKDLRKTPKPLLLAHIESRLGTLSKRSIEAQNQRNTGTERQRIDLSRLNTETLAYLADALNKSRRG